MTNEEQFSLSFPVSKEGLEKVMQELAKEGTATVNKISKIEIVTYKCPVLTEFMSGNASDHLSRTVDAIVHFEDNKPKKIICPLYDKSNSKCIGTDKTNYYSHLRNIDECLLKTGFQEIK
ncbi:MAG: hypothetical protein V1660_02610 [archaeon]